MSAWRDTKPSVFASLLPGIRHLRAPLAAGYLWLVTAWVAFYDRWDTDAERGASADAILELRDEATSAGLAIAVSFVAYVIGSMSQAVSSWLAESITRVVEPVTSSNPPSGRLSERGVRQLASLIRREERAAEETLYSREFKDREHIGRWANETEAPLVGSQRFVQNLDQKRTEGRRDLGARILRDEIEALVENDLPLVHLRLAGAETTRELFSEIDRTKAEAELRLAIWLPLGALTIALGLREWGTRGLLVAAIAAVVMCALGTQGIRRLRAANDSLVDAVRSHAAQLPTFELLRERSNTADAAPF